MGSYRFMDKCLWGSHLMRESRCNWWYLLSEWASGSSLIKEVSKVEVKQLDRSSRLNCSIGLGCKFGSIPLSASTESYTIVLGPSVICTFCAGQSSPFALTQCFGLFCLQFIVLLLKFWWSFVLKNRQGRGFHSQPASQSRCLKGTWNCWREEPEQVNQLLF